MVSLREQPTIDEVQRRTQLLVNYLQTVVQPGDRLLAALMERAQKEQFQPVKRSA